MSTPQISRGDAGLSMVEMMVILLLFGIISAAAVPTFQDLTDGMRLAQGAREVERELQTARLKAVTSNRPIRVRFNCPVAGAYRMVELIGSPSVPAASDDAPDRCSVTSFPYPAADDSPTTRPNHDGPIRRLRHTLSFGTAATLEFWPDGTVHRQAAGELPWNVLPGEGTAITVVKNGVVKTITVNGLGKIQLQ